MIRGFLRATLITLSCTDEPHIKQQNSAPHTCYCSSELIEGLLAFEQ